MTEDLLYNNTIQKFHCWQITLPDGTVNYMWPSGLKDNEEYHEIAKRMGYSNWEKYAWEHDLTHIWLAYKLEWPYSQALYDGAHGIPVTEMSERTAYEEHMTNSLQAFYYSRMLDEYGQVEEVFPDLDQLRLELKKLYEGNVL